MVQLGLLMSDTGRGHRAAATALEAALQHRYPGAFAAQQVDVLREFGAPPWNRAPEITPLWVHYSPASFNVLVGLTSRMMATNWGEMRFLPLHRWEDTAGWRVATAGTR